MLLQLQQVQLQQVQLQQVQVQQKVQQGHGLCLGCTAIPSSLPNSDLLLEATRLSSAVNIHQCTYAHLRNVSYSAPCSVQLQEVT